MSKRLNPKDRKAEILHAALLVAELKGYSHIQRSDVATAAGVSPARVSQLFNTMVQLRRAVMRHAIKTRHHKIIAQGLAVGDKQALKAPQELKQAAVATML